MNNKKHLEEKLLDKNSSSSYEDEIKKQAELEIMQARREKEAKKKTEYFVETNINKIKKELRFDKNTIYSVFNRKHKTETFVNGEQAENLIKYTDEYVVKFDHRLIG